MSKIDRASISSKLNYCQQWWPALRNAQARTILTVTAILSIIVIYQSGMLTDADALTRYFNCTTRAANKNGTYHSKMSIIVMTTYSKEQSQQRRNYRP